LITFLPNLTKLPPNGDTTVKGKHKSVNELATVILGGPITPLIGRYKGVC
jgi:hypothetical protein